MIDVRFGQMERHGLNRQARGDSQSDTVHDIARYVCDNASYTYGTVLQWGRTSGNCACAVQCPTRATQLLVDEAELEELEQWADAESHALICGIRSE